MEQYKYNLKVSIEPIIECFGNMKKYENIAIQIAEVLKKEIITKQLEQHFKNINFIKSHPITPQEEIELNFIEFLGNKLNKEQKKEKNN